MVYGCLFASDGDLSAQRYGFDRVTRCVSPSRSLGADPVRIYAQIQVWMARGGCPHAIESTAALLELILRDAQVVGPSYRPSQHELRLSYSMALIR